MNNSITKTDSAYSWLARCEVVVDKKLKVVMRPVRVVQYCKHPFGGLRRLVSFVRVGLGRDNTHSLCEAVWLNSCWTGLDLTKLVYLYPIQHKQNSWILTSQTGGQPYSDFSHYKVSECSLVRAWCSLTEGDDELPDWPELSSLNGMLPCLFYKKKLGGVVTKDNKTYHSCWYEPSSPSTQELHVLGHVTVQQRVIWYNLN